MSLMVIDDSMWRKLSELLPKPKGRPGLEHDIKSAEKLLDGESSDFLLADRGYNCDAFRKILQERGTEPVIPGKKNRLVKVEYDAHIYRERNFVERFLSIDQ